MKKRISILLIITILTISFCVPVSASDSNIPSGYLKTKEMFFQIMKDVGYIGTLPIRGFHQALNEFLNAKGLTGEAEQIQSDEDALNYINNGVSVQGDNNVVLTGNSLEFTKWFIDEEVSESGMFYSYSYAINDHIREMPSSEFYNALKELCLDYQNNYYLVIFPYASTYYVALVPQNEYDHLINVKILHYPYSVLIFCFS